MFKLLKFFKVNNPCEQSVDIAPKCLENNITETMVAYQKKNDLIWFYDIETRSCRQIKRSCIIETNLNVFNSAEACKNQCLPQVNDIQTQS